MNWTGLLLRAARFLWPQWSPFANIDIWYYVLGGERGGVTAVNGGSKEVYSQLAEQLVMSLSGWTNKYITRSSSVQF